MKSTLLISYILGLAFALACEGQKEVGVLELRIITKEINVPYEKDPQKELCQNSCPELRYVLINNAKQDFVLYNFLRHTHLAYFENELLCDSTWTADGKTFYLFTEEGAFEPASPDLHDSTARNPKGLERLLKMSSTWIRNSRIMIRSGERIEFKEKIDFRHYGLRPGKYMFKLGYAQFGPYEELSSSGKNEDLAEASLFVGCLKSDGSKLIVQ